MAGRGVPTHLKRQKELKRAAKAQAKREAKQARRGSRTEAAGSQDVVADQVSPERDAAADEAPKD